MDLTTSYLGLKLKNPIVVGSSTFTGTVEGIANCAKAGAAGLVLFNRFYNPTIDIENMKVVPGSALSVEEENSDTLRWISLLSAQGIPCCLSASTGVHKAEDVVRQILAGATTVQVCSTLYRNGVKHIADMVAGLEGWMKKHNFNSINDFKGKCSASADVKVFERLQIFEKK